MGSQCYINLWIASTESFYHMPKISKNNPSRRGKRARNSTHQLMFDAEHPTPLSTFAPSASPKYHHLNMGTSQKYGEVPHFPAASRLVCGDSTAGRPARWGRNSCGTWPWNHPFQTSWNPFGCLELEAFPPKWSKMIQNASCENDDCPVGGTWTQKFQTIPFKQFKPMYRWCSYMYESTRSGGHLWFSTRNGERW